MVRRINLETDQCEHGQERSLGIVQVESRCDGALEDFRRRVVSTAIGEVGTERHENHRPPGPTLILFEQLLQRDRHVFAGLVRDDLDEPPLVLQTPRAALGECGDLGRFEFVAIVEPRESLQQQ